MSARRGSRAGVAREAAPATPEPRGTDGAKSCPSGTCEEGALLLGVMTGDGRLAYVQPPTRVDADFVARARELGRPEARFRFSVPCVEARCPQWTGKGCGVVEHVLEEESARPVEAASLPRCGIRASCRWYSQRGADACHVCPLVVADTGGTATYSSTHSGQAPPGD